MNKTPVNSVENIRLIPLTPADAGIIASLERLCFTDPWSEAAVSGTLSAENAVCLAAEHCGKIVGYGFIYISVGEADIADIAVVPEYRRRGIGSALIGALLDEASRRGAYDVYLEVRRSNITAAAMYEKLGFFRCGVRRGYYRSPKEDAIIMCRRASEM